MSVLNDVEKVVEIILDTKEEKSRRQRHKEKITMSFSEIEMELANVGITLNNDLTVQVTSDEEATDAEIILESYLDRIAQRKWESAMM